MTCARDTHVSELLSRPALGNRYQAARDVRSHVSPRQPNATFLSYFDHWKSNVDIHGEP